MNKKRWLVASVGVYVAFMILGYIIDGIILKGQYQATAALWRPAAEMKTWISWITTAIFSLLFVYIFIKGYEGKGILEGVRYGLWIGLLITIPTSYSLYAAMPIPYSLAFWWWVLGTIEIIICGVVAAWLYKPAVAPKLAPEPTPPSPTEQK